MNYICIQIFIYINMLIMKTVSLFLMLMIGFSLSACNSGTKELNKPEETKKQPENTAIKTTLVENMTTSEFKEKIFDYTTNTEWSFSGETPVIIDFYADWCRPCKMIAPIMEELAKEYEGKIIIYKIDTQKETELATAFGIRSIPSLLFIPTNGPPQMTTGAFSKEQYIKMINEIIYQQNK